MKKLLLLLLFPLTVLATGLDLDPRYKTMGNPDADGTPAKYATLYRGNEKKVVKVGCRTCFDGGWKLMTNNLGAVIPDTVALFETSLRSKITSTATTMTLVSGTTLNSTTLNGFYGFVIDEGTASQEFVTATCVDTACSGMTRGISALDGKTSVTALKFEHGRGASVKMTDYPQLTIISRILNGDETIPNLLEYSTTTPSITAASSSKTLIDKAYADGLAIAGSPDGSETVNGIWEGATRDEMLIGAETGSTGAGLLLQNKYATSTPSATTTIPITGSNGKLSQSFLDLTQGFTFSGANNYSGTSTFSGNLNANGTNTMATTTFSVTPIIPTATSTSAGQVIGLDANGKIPSMTDGSLIITPVSTTTQVIASDVLKISADTASSTAATSFAKSKEVLVRRAGTYRIKFDLRDVNVVTHGAIYKNGTIFGTDRATAGANTQTWTTYSEDKIFSINDLIQIYFYTTNGSFEAQLRNFRIYYSYEEPLPDYNINIP